MPKTSGGTSGRPLVPQPHGGALKPGGDGVSGGRPKSVIRARAARLFDEAGMDFLTGVLAGEVVDARVSDKIRAAEIAAKVGVGAERGHDDRLVKALADATFEVFAGDPRLDELAQRWVQAIGALMRGDDA